VKKLLLVLILVIITVAGTGIYFYSRITYQPSWHANGGARLKGDAVELKKKAVKALKNGKQVRLKLDQLLLIAMSELESRTDIQFEKAVKGYQLTLAPPDLEVEMLVDWQALPLGRLPQEARATAEKLVKALPKAALKSLYLRSRLTPVVKNGTIRLGASSDFSIGKIDVSLEKLKKALGDNLEIPLSGLPVQNFKLLKDAVLLIPGGGNSAKCGLSTIVWRMAVWFVGGLPLSTDAC